MEVDLSWIDVTPYLASGRQPFFPLPRDKAHGGAKAWAGGTQIGTVGEFWVLQGDPLAGDAPFAVVRSGDVVVVPVLAYRTAFRALPALFGLGLQIGLAAATQLRNHTRDVPKSACLVLGHDCTDLTPEADAFRCYVGLAFRTK